MRFLITAIICSLFAGCALTPKQAVTSVEIEEIKPRYIETEQFKRISEYLTGKENIGDRVILRTQSEHREGYSLYSFSIMMCAAYPMARL